MSSSGSSSPSITRGVSTIRLKSWGYSSGDIGFPIEARKSLSACNVRIRSLSRRCFAELSEVSIASLFDAFSACRRVFLSFLPRVLAGVVVAESGSGDLGVEGINDCWLKISKLIVNTAKHIKVYYFQCYFSTLMTISPSSGSSNTAPMGTSTFDVSLSTPPCKYS